MQQDAPPAAHDYDFYDRMVDRIRHHYFDPHSIFGLHSDDQGNKIIRLWRPDAQHVFLELFNKIVQASQVHPAGLFEYQVPHHTNPLDYRVYHHNGMLDYDPYAFWPTLGHMDRYLFGKGVHYQLAKVMGGRLAVHEGVAGAKFSVWAPSAKRMALVGDFNHWDGRANPMRCLGECGIWEIFIPGLKAGEKYKFEIITQTGELKIKSDPYGLAGELRPNTASVLADIDTFQWNDHAWLQERVEKKDQPKPMAIYEVHLGSWRKRNGDFLNYREIAQQLVAYCHEMGFTHVELMPIQEHPLDESWGYQVSGFYAVTSRFGTPQDFQWFVNHLHTHNIGVFLDWVPGHFPTDDFSLSRFDGTALYEHEDPRKGFHPHWSTYIFNFGRHEVTNFLIANAIFWFEQMHIDGLRVDAVASMLYLDYGRNEGEWIPNPYGGKENLEAIEFFKHLNSIVHQKHPGVQMIAEESTSFLGVTHALEHGGLGFDMKWNMGWMNDTLRYFSTDMIFRCYHQNDLTFGLIYAFSERFALVLSHDEVVHGKKSLISKMPGDMWQKFANLRLLYSYMICQPGKKLLFMGGEIGQWNEWYCKSEIEWFLLDFPTHRGVQSMVKELNHLYRATGALWERDFDHTGFEWVDFGDRQNSVIIYIRKGSLGDILCVHNFTPTYHQEYFIHMTHVLEIKEVFNSDDAKYGGAGNLNAHPHISQHGVSIRLAPLATMMFTIKRGATHDHHHS